MQRDEFEHSLQNREYRYQSEFGFWRKLNTEYRTGIPTIGRGLYRQFHDVEIGETSVNQSLKDNMQIPGKLLMAREIKPFPFEAATHVRVKIAGGFAQRHFTIADFEFEQSNTYPNSPTRSGLEKKLVFGIPDFYTAYYNNRGFLTSLHLGADEAVRLVFRFKSGVVIDLAQNPPIYLGKLSEYVNTPRRLLLNERLYTIQKNPSDITCRILNPVGSQVIGKVALPPRLRMSHVADVLTAKTSDWLQINEHIPVTASLRSRST